MKITSRLTSVNDLSVARAHPMSESAMASVIAGQRCVGFLIGRGVEGIEAFDRDEHSLGLFACPIQAAAAVESAAKSGPATPPAESWSAMWKRPYEAPTDGGAL
jgi:hypothetical protein